MTLQLKTLGRLQAHPQPYLRNHWYGVQLGVLLLPFSPLLGGLGILLISIAIWAKYYQVLTQCRLCWAIGVLAAWLIVTACFAAEPSDAFLGLYHFLPLFVIFTAQCLLIQTPLQLRQLSWLLVIATVPVVIIGWGQLFWGWAGHPQVLWLVLDLLVDPGGNPPGRMASIFSYANFLASYLVIVFTLGLGLWFEACGSLLQQLSSGRMQQKQNLAKPLTRAWLEWLCLGLAVLSIAIALILTNSRNAWAISSLVCIAFALYQGWYWLVTSVGILTGSVLGAAFGPAPVKQWLRHLVPSFFWARVSDELYPDRPIALLRSTQWKFAWSLTQQRPWTGWGLRSFTQLYQAQMQIWVGHPHSLLLMLTAETGLPATVLLLSLVGYILYQGVLYWLTWPKVFHSSGAELNQNKLIFFSYLVAFGACTLFSTVDVAVFDFRINLLGWLLLAAIYGLVYQQQRATLTN